LRRLGLCHTVAAALSSLERRRVLRARLIILVVALTAFAAVSAVATAAPRTGVYIDPPLQVYLKTKGNEVKSFQAPCIFDGAMRGTLTVKGLHISKKGKFHFNGKAKYFSGSNTKIDVNIKGKIGKKAKGSYKSTDPNASCEDTSFTAKYYGKHPQG
jgi:hypothetical protein